MFIKMLDFFTRKFFFFFGQNVNEDITTIKFSGFKIPVKTERKVNSPDNLLAY